MPSFPQHRNMKGQSKNGSGQNNSVNNGAGDQTSNLPAIPDFFAALVKKRRVD